jgi:thioredoxin-dependent peroxiredoxin
MVVLKSKPDSGDTSMANDDKENAAPDAAAPDNSTSKTLNIGDVLPPITLKNEKEEDINVSGLTAKNGVVFFLIPKADTCKIGFLVTNASSDH